MASTNPFVMIHEALWSLLEANSDFTSLVKPGNRIKFTNDNVRDPEKVGLTGSYPKVRIETQGGASRFYRTSNGTSIVKRYVIQVASGDKRLSKCLDVEWAIFRALADWITTMEALTWGGNSFVKRCDPLGIEETLDNQALNQGARGWSAVWAGEIEMWFSTEALKP